MCNFWKNFHIVSRGANIFNSLRWGFINYQRNQGYIDNYYLYYYFFLVHFNIQYMCLYQSIFCILKGIKRTFYLHLHKNHPNIHKKGGLCCFLFLYMIDRFKYFHSLYRGVGIIRNRLDWVYWSNYRDSHRRVLFLCCCYMWGSDLGLLVDKFYIWKNNFYILVLLYHLSFLYIHNCYWNLLFHLNILDIG